MPFLDKLNGEKNDTQPISVFEDKRLAGDQASMQPTEQAGEVKTAGLDGAKPVTPRKMTGSDINPIMSNVEAAEVLKYNTLPTQEQAAFADLEKGRKQEERINEIAQTIGDGQKVGIVRGQVVVYPASAIKVNPVAQRAITRSLRDAGFDRAAIKQYEGELTKASLGMNYNREVIEGAMNAALGDRRERSEDVVINGVRQTVPRAPTYVNQNKPGLKELSAILDQADSRGRAAVEESRGAIIGGNFKTREEVVSAIRSGADKIGVDPEMAFSAGIRGEVQRAGKTPPSQYGSLPSDAFPLLTAIAKTEEFQRNQELIATSKQTAQDTASARAVTDLREKEALIRSIITGENPVELFTAESNKGRADSGITADALKSAVAENISSMSRSPSGLLDKVISAFTSSIGASPATTAAGAITFLADTVRSVYGKNTMSNADAKKLADVASGLHIGVRDKADEKVSAESDAALTQKIADVNTADGTIKLALTDKEASVVYKSAKDADKDGLISYEEFVKSFAEQSGLSDDEYVRLLNAEKSGVPGLEAVGRAIRQKLGVALSEDWKKQVNGADSNVLKAAAVYSSPATVITTNANLTNVNEKRKFDLMLQRAASNPDNLSVIKSGGSSMMYIATPAQSDAGFTVADILQSTDPEIMKAVSDVASQSRVSASARSYQGDAGFMAGVIDGDELVRYMEHAGISYIPTRRELSNTDEKLRPMLSTVTDKVARSFMSGENTAFGAGFIGDQWNDGFSRILGSKPTTPTKMIEEIRAYTQFANEFGDAKSKATTQEVDGKTTTESTVLESIPSRLAKYPNVRMFKALGTYEGTSLYYAVKANKALNGPEMHAMFENGSPEAVMAATTILRHGMEVLSEGQISSFGRDYVEGNGGVAAKKNLSTTEFITKNTDAQIVKMQTADYAEFNEIRSKSMTDLSILDRAIDGQIKTMIDMGLSVSPKLRDAQGVVKENLFKLQEEASRVGAAYSMVVAGDYENKERISVEIALRQDGMSRWEASQKVKDAQMRRDIGERSARLELERGGMSRKDAQERIAKGRVSLTSYIRK